MTPREFRALCEADRRRWGLLDDIISRVSNWIYMCAPFKDKTELPPEHFKALE